MKNAGTKWLSLLLCLGVLLALAACGASGGNPDTGAGQEADAGNGAAESAEEAAQTQTLQLGTSPYAVTIPASYVSGEMTEEDVADDQVGYYYSDAFLLDFDVYQFSKEGYPDTLAAFVMEEAADYAGTDIVTDGEINGIPVASYRSVEASEGVDYNVITYAFENGDEYLEIAFWLDGDTAEAEADAIIQTLTK